MVGAEAVEPGIDLDVAAPGGMLSEGPVEPEKRRVPLAQGGMDGGNLVGDRLVFGQRFELGQEVPGLAAIASLA